MTDSTGSGGFQVSASDLESHAQAVQQAASTVGTALSAAQQVTLGVQAYGLICGPVFVPIVQAVSAPGVTTLGLTQQSLASAATTLGQTVTNYSGTEDANTAGFTALAEDA